jgi:hypothetical protein
MHDQSRKAQHNSFAHHRAKLIFMPAPMTTEGPGPQPRREPQPERPTLTMQVRHALLGRAASMPLAVH